MYKLNVGENEMLFRDADSADWLYYELAPRHENLKLFVWFKQNGWTRVDMANKESK